MQRRVWVDNTRSQLTIAMPAGRNERPHPTSMLRALHSALHVEKQAILTLCTDLAFQWHVCTGVCQPSLPQAGASGDNGQERY